MIYSDALIEDVGSISSNINTIDVNVITKIQKELDSYDVISLVFILYDAPDTALQRLIVYQRVSRDVGEDDLNILNEWARYAQSRSTWRYEFLEALAVCQLYAVIRKLGFHVPSVKKHFLPDTVDYCLHIHPMKKVLYKICENVDSNTLKKLKKTFGSYNMNTAEYESCELILLELLSKKFIIINLYNTNKPTDAVSVEKLVKIIEKYPLLKLFADYLRIVENRLNNKTESLKVTSTSTSTSPMEDNIDDNEINDCDMDEIHKLLADINLDDFKSDSQKNHGKLTVAYPIKNSKRVGICYIINQEIFHPSKLSIDDADQSEPLEDRIGSTNDKIVIEKTMLSLNFEVISRDNMEHNELIKSITDVIKNQIEPDDSIFMLCILSHGVKGHIFSADSIKIKVDDIQNLLDCSSNSLHNIPKVLIIQACQVKSNKNPRKLLKDSPTTDFYLKKSEFIIFWATAPAYEAYRYGEKGSIFIQLLCRGIRENYEQEHLNDIFTIVNRMVKHVSTKLRVNQMPIFHSTLTRKIYLPSSSKIHI